jgi:hypothetical protein
MNHEELHKLVARLVAREEELLQALRESQPKPRTKDTWDKLATLLPFVSGVLLTSVGLYFTVSYNRQADRLAQLQTLERFIPQITGSKENRKIAMRMIAALGTPQMVAALTDFLVEGTDEEKRIASATLVATAIVIFDNTNTELVGNRGASPVFTITRPHLITNLWNYHWNDGRGATRGKISLRRNDGTEFGPWEVTTSSGHGGAPNVNWECSPNITIPPGTYSVIDSDPTTWSQNPGSKGMGFSRVKGTPLDSAN